MLLLVCGAWCRSVPGTWFVVDGVWECFWVVSVGVPQPAATDQPVVLPMLRLNRFKIPAATCQRAGSITVCLHMLVACICSKQHIILRISFDDVNPQVVYTFSPLFFQELAMLQLV